MTNRNRHILLWGAFAAVLVLVSSIGSAGAYFTTYAEAKGSLII